MDDTPALGQGNRSPKKPPRALPQQNRPYGQRHVDELISGEYRPPACRTNRSQFTTTHWTVVLSAGELGSTQAAAALEQLCRTYWYPLYAYTRRRGQIPIRPKTWSRVLRHAYREGHAR